MASNIKEGAATKELEECRKALLKSKPDSLTDGSLLGQGIELALRPRAVADHLKTLEVVVAVLRQMSAILSSHQPVTHLTILIENQVSPALQPRGALASLVIVNLEHPQKNQQARAAEVLNAAGKLSKLMPLPSASSSEAQTFMIPFFRQAISSGISRRSNLAAIAALLPFMPLSSIPVSLSSDLLQDLSIVDGANIRCTLIVEVLVRLSGPHESDTARIEAVIGPLIPYFDSSSHPHSTLNHLNRYLLPALFKTDSSYITSLLNILSQQKDLFAAWVTVASLGVSSGHINIDDLPSKDIHDALSHEDADVRIRAFELVSGSKAQFSPQVIEMVKEGFCWNNSLPNSGGRSAFSSATYAFLVRLHQLETSTRRIFRRKLSPAVEAEQASLSHIIPLSTAFREWLLASYLDEGLRQARRTPVFRILSALNLLDRYLEVFGETGDTQTDVFTEDRVEMLFACQTSEFTEVRSRARKILQSATIPLPGYETLATPKSQALISSAMASLNLPRKTQAEAGKSTLCILFGKLARNGEDADKALAFVTNLVDRLEIAVAVAETNLVNGIEEYPLHGSLAAIGDLLLCLDLSTPDVQALWRLLFHRLFDLINRIWGVTRTVISLAPSKVDGVLDSARPDHEIARAYEVMGGDDAEGDDEESMDHTGLLSGCWRATRNAGELLATIFCLPVSYGGPTQQVWKKAEVDQAGQCFLTWMHEIRHRGSFSKIALAFAQFVEAVRPVPDLADLCDDWLKHELATISSDQHSTTRRSAALPYSILSLVSSDNSLLNTALNSLLDLARVDNDQTSNITKVHAFNVLKIVLLDARQAKVFSQWFEKGVMTALGAFESADWNVRNVGLILFSTLVHRCLSPPRGGQDYYRSRSTLATRPNFSSFHTKYPLVIPFIIKHLNRDRNDGTGLNRHSPLFPILIIVRSLRWSEEGAGLQKQLRVAVLPYLSSREYQVRQVAAQALSSLLSSSSSVDQCIACLSVPEINKTLNAVHGDYLLALRLISDVIQWSEVSVSTKQKIESLLIEAVERYVPGTSPSICQAVIACVKSYQSQNVALTTELIDRASSRALTYLSAFEEGETFVPAEETRRAACTSLLLQYRPSENLLIQLLSAGEDDQLLALGKIRSIAQLRAPLVFERVLTLALNGKEGTGVQVTALDLLAEVDWSDEVLESIRSKWDLVILRLEKLMGSKCVPVKEAGLVALGWAAHHKLSLGKAENHGQVLEVVAIHILNTSHEDESQPARYVAYRSLSHLTPHLFSHPNSVLIRAVIRLVQDDDEEIRIGAAEVICLGLGRKRGVVQCKAVEMVWTWLKENLAGSGSETLRHGGKWVEWIEELAVDKAGLDLDIKTLDDSESPDVLFEVEPSNIFRDPLVDLHYANDLLSSLSIPATKVNSAHEELEIALNSSRGSVKGKGKAYSPIDDLWEARRTIERRLKCARPKA